MVAVDAMQPRSVDNSKKYDFHISFTLVPNQLGKKDQMLDVICEARRSHCPAVQWKRPGHLGTRPANKNLLSI